MTSRGPFDPVLFADRLLALREQGGGSRDALCPAWFGTALLFAPRVGSTQEEARRLLRGGAPDGTVVLAGEQTAGRGRRGRPWQSPAGLGIWMTVIVRPVPPPPASSLLAVAAAVAACQAVRRLGAGNVEIKWPNDLIAGRRKLGGVLGEIVADPDAASALLGVGLNIGLDPSHLPPEVAAIATSLRNHGLARAAESEDLVAGLVERMGAAFGELRRGRVDALLDRWRSLSPTSAGTRVTVEDPGGARFSGTTRGITADGSLVLECADGHAREIRHGGSLSFEEVSNAPAH